VKQESLRAILSTTSINFRGKGEILYPCFMPASPHRGDAGRLIPRQWIMSLHANGDKNYPSQ